MRSHATSHDDQIVELFWRRDESAIRKADEKYGSQLLQLARSILYDPGACEECKNDTYLAAWNAIPPARPKLLGAYLSTLARHIAINRYFAEHRKKRIPSELTVSIEECGDLFSSSDPVSEALDEQELGAAISTFLGGLTARRRYIFMARFWFAESVRDIATHLHVSESSVYKELAVLRQALKRDLQRKGVLS